MAASRVPGPIGILDLFGYQRGHRKRSVQADYLALCDREADQGGQACPSLTSSPLKRMRALDGDSRGDSAPRRFLPTEAQQALLEPLSAASGATACAGQPRQKLRLGVAQPRPPIRPARKWAWRRGTGTSSPCCRRRGLGRAEGPRCTH